MLLLVVLMQGVISVEVMGTCHSETEKAAVLKPVHIQRYQLHAERGLSFDPPEVPLNTCIVAGAATGTAILHFVSRPLKHCATYNQRSVPEEVDKVNRGGTR